MFAALAAVLTGVFYVNNYACQETRRDTVSSQTVIVPPNEYGHIRLQLNMSEDNLWLSLKITNGTIREATVNDENYPAYLNGSYTATWTEIPNPNRPSDSQIYEEAYPLGYNFPESTHFIFWNPDSPISKQVTVTAYTEHDETVYNLQNLQVGCLFIALGAVSGLSAAFWLGKRVLFVVVALVLIVAGGFLAATNTQLVYHEETACSFSLTIPAYACVNEPIHYNASGAYAVMIRVDKGTVNATVMLDQDFASFSQGTFEPDWAFGTGSRLEFGGRPYNAQTTNDVCLVLVNPDNYVKETSVQIIRGWEEYNYPCLAGGVTSLLLGFLVLYFSNRSQLTRFNKALEHQE